jgi:hypothetical protein
VRPTGLRPIAHDPSSLPDTPNGFTDEWVNLANALKTVRMQNRTDLRPEDMELVISLQRAAESALAGRPS